MNLEVHSIQQEEKDEAVLSPQEEMNQSFAQLRTKNSATQEMDKPTAECDDDDDPFQDFLFASKKRLTRAEKKHKQIKIVLSAAPDKPHSTEAASPRKRAKRTSSDKLLVDRSSSKNCSVHSLISDSDLEFFHHPVSYIHDNEYDVDLFDGHTSFCEDEDEIEDCLEFLQETHEDQDPEWNIYQSKLRREEAQKKLDDLDKFDQQGRNEIETVVQQQVRDKQMQTDISVEKYKLREGQRRTAKLARLEQLYREKTNSINQKVHEGIKLLRSRHQKEVQAAMQQHQYRQQQQQPHQRRLSPEAMAAAAAAEWQQTSQQITVNQNRKLQEFTTKGEDWKKRTEADYRREHDKILNEYNLKMSELDSGRQKLLQREYANAQQSRQRFLKRHMQTIMKQREELLRELRNVDQQAADIAVDTSLVIAPGEYEHVAAGEGIMILEDHSMFAKPVPLYMEDSSTHSHRDSVLLSTATDIKASGDKLNPPSPIKSYPGWLIELQRHNHHFSGSSTRHKHRKGVMSQASRQITVEIHNEGIWILISETGDENETSNSSSNDNKAATNSHEVPDGGNQDQQVKKPSSSANDIREFLAWGVKACSFLESIVCGEIPPGYNRLFDHLQKETTIMHGGQIRCVLLDLRTGEATASLSRAKAIQEYQTMVMTELEKRVSDMNRKAAEAEQLTGIAESKLKEQERIVISTRRELDKAKLIQEEFTTKFRNFLGPDGKPLPQGNPTDSQELLKAMMSYKNDVETAARREKNAMQQQDDYRTTLQKVQAVMKNAKLQAAYAAEMLSKRKQAASVKGTGALSESASIDFDSLASFRVKDIMGALKKTADKRREQANQRSGANFNSVWIQSFPGLSTSLKKYLWHKMHRRKQQIILRPTPESLVNEMKAYVSKALISDLKRDPTEEEMIEAERLYLLASHPVDDAKLPQVPSSKSNESWAEPGWKLNLDVPEDEEYASHFVLPRMRSFPVMENFCSEISSASGRQASSLLCSSHLRYLASPLSIFSMASSPTETNPTLTQNASLAEGDPFNVSEETLSIGYTFREKPQHVPQPQLQTQPQTQQQTQTKRKSVTGKEKNPDPIPSPSKPASSSATTVATSGVDQTSETRVMSPPEKKKAEPKKRRASGKGNSIPSPRSQKQKKSADSVQSLQSATPFNLFTQQQRTQQQNRPQQQAQQQQRQQQQQLSQQQRQQQQLLAQQQNQQLVQQQQQKLPSQSQINQQQSTGQAQLLQQQQHRQQRVSQHQGNPQQQQQVYQNQSQRSQQQSPQPQQRHQIQQQRLQQQTQPQQALQQQQQQQQQHAQYQNSYQVYQSQPRQPQSSQTNQFGSQPQQQQQEQQRYVNTQMAFRMMQQSQSPNNSSRQMGQMPGSYPQQALQQMNQFYGTPLNHPSASIGYIQQQQHRPAYPNPQQLPGIPGGSPAGQQQQHQQGNQGGSNDQNDPLFMLK